MEMRHNIQGLSKLERTFRNLPRTSQNKVFRPALRAGGNVVRNAASVNVLSVADKGYATGLLARSIRVYALRQVRGMLRVGIMVRRGLVNTSKIVNGLPVRVGLYASVLEFGKKNQPPRSWMRKAIREQKDAVLTAVVVEVRKRLPSAVNGAKK